VINYHLSIQPF